MNTIGKMTLLATLAVSQQASSQSSGEDFTLVRHSINSGGGNSEGGLVTEADFRLYGTAGQVVAGTRSSGSFNGETFTVSGGFLAIMSREDMLFGDGFEQPVLPGEPQS